MDEPGNTEFRVLVLPSTAKDFELTREIMREAGIESLQCSGIDDLCSKINEGAGAALVVEEALAGTANDALTRCLAAQPAWSDLPLLVLAATGADSARVGGVMDKVGTVTVLERPTRIVILVSAVRTALRARARQYQVRDDSIALQAARDNLEVRVRERTSELKRANTKLAAKIREAEAAEEQVRELLRRLVSAQEDERAAIARDLHDELGQQITSLRLHLSYLARDLPEDAKTLKTLRVAEKVAAGMDSGVSFLSWTIRPTAIDSLGLSAALSEYVKEWSQTYGIATEFRAALPRKKRLLAEIEITLYRIAQECLNNISKYSKATTVSILLSVEKKKLSLIVEDNGVGFDVSSNHPANGTGGLGIAGMRERASLLNGTLEIESGPKSGTSVYVRVPAQYR